MNLRKTLGVRTGRSLMAPTQETGSNSGLSQRQYLVVGIVASVCALLITPVINAISPLYFVGGMIISVIAPGFSGLIALASGIQLYRLQKTRQGVGLVIGSILTALIGALYGLNAVF